MHRAQASLPDATEVGISHLGIVGETSIFEQSTKTLVSPKVPLPALTCDRILRSEHQKYSFVPLPCLVLVLDIILLRQEYK